MSTGINQYDMIIYEIQRRHREPNPNHASTAWVDQGGTGKDVWNHSTQHIKDREWSVQRADRCGGQDSRCSTGEDNDNTIESWVIFLL